MVSPFELTQSERNSPSNPTAGLAVELKLLSYETSSASKQSGGKSVLSAAVDCLDPLAASARFILQDESRKASDKLQKNHHLSKDAEAKLAQEINAARTKADQLSTLHSQIEPYVTEGLKTTAMFARGRSGFFWTVAACALDECKTGQKAQEQLTDILLGSLKGAGAKLIFSRAGELDPVMKLIPIKYDLPMQAVSMGIATRALNVSLTRSTWVDQLHGRFDASRTVETISSQLLNPAALGTDVMAFGLSHGLVRGASRLTNLNLEQSPLASTVLLGAGYGVSAGGSSEILRQHEGKEQLDLGKVVTHALTQGAVDSLAAYVGGKQADNTANRIFRSLSIAEPGFPSAKSGTAKIESHALESDQSRLARASQEQGIEQHGACCSNGEPWKRAITLTPEPELPPAELYNKIIAARKGSEAISLYKGDAHSLFETKREYDKLVSRDDLPVRIYYARGHDLEIMVPESHARELDQVRCFRIHGKRTQALANKRDGFTFSALPEDFIPQLEELPNSTLVKRVNVLGHQDPYTSWLRKQKNDPSWTTAADARPEGIITFYEPTKFYDTLKSTVGHEWAHLLHHNLPEELRVYGAAYRVEAHASNAYNARPYALTNEMENWAVLLGEELLAYDANRFLRTAVHAPIRSAILARAIKWALTEAPQPETCTYKMQLQKRVELIEQRITEPAVKKLEDEIRNAKEPSNDQIELLTYLSSRCDIKLLKELAGRVSSYETAELIVARGAKMLENQPEERFEFLWELANRKLVTAPFARGEFESQDIARFYGQKLAKLEAQLKPTDPELYSRIQDLSEWHWVRQNYKECEVLKAKLLRADESLHGPGHEITETTRMRLGLAMLAQGKFRAARPELERSFESLSKSTSGELDDEVRMALTGLCDIYNRLSLPLEALRCTESARAYFNRLYGPNNPSSTTLQARIDSLAKEVLRLNTGRLQK